MFLQLRDVQKSFGPQVVLRGIDLDVVAGEIVVLLGPSGCGKTTLLRMIAGLEGVTHGRIALHDQSITHLPPHQRGFGFVFQDYALFPHKNVADNVAFGLRMQQWSRPQMAERVAQVLALVGLDGFGHRSVHELSGGERQRVALARSLAPAPQLLLLDEPLGALDRALRERLMLELRQILKQAGVLAGQAEGMTAVYVTHDQAEAFAIADRVAVMNDGFIEQVGPPERLYQAPETPFVARFLGMENVLSGRVVSLAPLCVDTAVGRLVVAGDPAAWQVGEEALLLVRPEAAQLVDGAAPGVNVVYGRVQSVSFRGRYQIVNLALPGLDAPLKLEWETAVAPPAPQTHITCMLAPAALRLLRERKFNT